MNPRSVLLGLVFAVEAAAAPDAAVFADSKIDVPSVYLSGAVNVPGPAFSPVRTPVVAPRVVASDMPVAVAPSGVEYKGVVKAPESGVDYKMKVLEVEVTTSTSSNVASRRAPGAKQ